jgi:hypothetical protein
MHINATSNVSNVGPTLEQTKSSRAATLSGRNIAIHLLSLVFHSEAALLMLRIEHYSQQAKTVGPPDT